MFLNILKPKNLVNSTNLFSLFLFPFLVSCASSQNNIIEVINPPKIPSEFSTIPDQVVKPELLPLISVDKKIDEIKSGRINPFLPLGFDDELKLPSSFKYYGQISSRNNLNAFVSYEDRIGTVITGDIGGQTTDLLPFGWTILELDIDTKVLTLGFGDRSVDVDLFSR